MAQEAIEPWNDRLFYFDYTHPDTTVRIVLRSVPNAPTARTVRSNVMWVLREVPIDLFPYPSIRGVEFKVQFNGQDLYTGKMSDKNRPAAAGVLEHGGAQGGNSSSGSSDETRMGVLLINEPSNASTESLSPNLPHQLAADRFTVGFQRVGLPLRDIDMFTTMLEFMLSLAAQDQRRTVRSIYFTWNTLPVWIYLIQVIDPGSTQSLYVGHVIPIILFIARYCVRRSAYEELTFSVLLNNKMLAGGCVAMGVEERRWCKGLSPMAEAGAPVLS